MVNLYRDPNGENIVLTTHSSASRVNMKNLSTADLTQRQNAEIEEARLGVSEMAFIWLIAIVVDLLPESQS